MVANSPASGGRTGRLNENLCDTGVSATIATCRQVLDVLHLKLSQKSRIMIKLLGSHILHAIISSSTGVWRTDADVNSHRSMRSRGRGQDVSWPQIWLRWDKTKDFGCCSWIPSEQSCMEAVPDTIMALG